MINDGSNVGRKNKESKVFPILYISLTQCLVCYPPTIVALTLKILSLSESL